MDTTKNSTMQERRAALDAAVSAALGRLGITKESPLRSPAVYSLREVWMAGEAYADASQSARIAALEGALRDSLASMEHDCYDLNDPGTLILRVRALLKGGA